MIFPQIVILHETQTNHFVDVIKSDVYWPQCGIHYSVHNQAWVLPPACSQLHHSHTLNPLTQPLHGTFINVLKLIYGEITEYSSRKANYKLTYLLLVLIYMCMSQNTESWIVVLSKYMNFANDSSPTLWTLTNASNIHQVSLSPIYSFIHTPTWTNKMPEYSHHLSL